MSFFFTDVRVAARSISVAACLASTACASTAAHAQPSVPPLPHDTAFVEQLPVAFGRVIIHSAIMGDATGAGLRVRRHRVSTFAWGGVALRGVDALGIDLSPMEHGGLRVPNGEPVLGIVGLSRLRRFVLVFDYPAHTLLLYPLTARERTSWDALPPLSAEVPLDVSSSALFKKLYLWTTQPREATTQRTIRYSI
jgi:hypothetical protein